MEKRQKELSMAMRRGGETEMKDEEEDRPDNQMLDLMSPVGLNAAALLKQCSV